MTAEGAGFRDSHWAARPWQAVRRLSARTSLRIKLVTALLALVAVALAVMGFVGVAVFGSYLQNQVDAQLRALNAQVLNDPFAFTGRSHQDVFLLNNSVVEILASNGQPVPGRATGKISAIPDPP